jgi:hypothetical protein
MEHNAYPVIMSFVIRFVMDESSSAEDVRHPYRGTIRHIQTNEELNFNTWDDVGKFMVLWELP